MKIQTLAGLFTAGLLALPLAAQMPEGYLDIDTVKVKMGKRMEFDAINKRMAEMNRKNGDRWTAWEVVYGDPNAVYIVSNRPTFAGAWEGMQTFDGAVKKSLGEMGMRKLYGDWDATVESEHDTLYRLAHGSVGLCLPRIWPPRTSWSARRTGFAW